MNTAEVVAKETAEKLTSEFTYRPKSNLRPSFGDFFIISRRLRKVVGVEVGVYKAENSVNMLKFDKRLFLYLVDPYQLISKVTGIENLSHDEVWQVKEVALKSIEPYGSRTKWMFEPSETASKRFPDNYFDYVYIDANHEYDSVKLDMEVWWKKLKRGGVMGGHDIIDSGVTKAFSEFVKDKDLFYPYSRVQLGAGLSDWTIIKP